MSDKRRVQVHFMLVGRSHKEKKNVSHMNNRQTHACVLNQIQDHFGDRPIHFNNKYLQLTDEYSNYPEFYAAGWFVSLDPIKDQSGFGSELVIMAHGNSIKDAKRNLMSNIAGTPWDDLARNI